MIIFSKKRTLALILALFLIGILTGCNVKKDTGDAVAKVNGIVITKANFDKHFEMLKKPYETTFGADIWSKDMGNGKTFEEEVKNSVLENLIMEEIILQKAKEKGITVTDEQVNEEIDNYKQLFGGEEKFKESLEKENITEEYFKESIKKQIIFNLFKEDFVNNLKLSDDEVKKYYEDNKDSYIQVKARHILVETEDEAKEILNKLKNGEDFAEIAKAKSKDEGSAVNGGDLGYFGKGQMVQEFEETAFSLQPGEISDIVKSTFGYHIIKVEDRLDTFEKVKDNVIQDVKNNKFNEELKQLREEANVEILLNN